MGKTLFLLAGVALIGFAQRGNGGQGASLRSLRGIPVPEPRGLDQYVLDKQALIALGKAFFWDMQAGSDGRTACATCHFHAGADHRLQNQLSNPASSRTSIPVRANQSLTADDFPFRKLANPTSTNGSTVLRDLRQVFGSAGVFRANFLDVQAGNPFDDGLAVTPEPGLFELGGIHARQVTGRNTPSVINAVFNVRNFWDGRARDIFTGSTPFGDSDSGLAAWASGDGRELQAERVRLDNSSLASQAVGPALNSVEMSYEGRSWPKLGRKLLSLQPLARQRVDAQDSVLGGLAGEDGYGLQGSYGGMIQAAFQSRYWESGAVQMELNFALFWGLAIQAYEATLVSDQTRYDAFMEGNQSALTGLEQQGLNEFRAGGSRCTNCHQGPELTAASYTNFRRRSQGANPDLPDTLGFFRLGVSPIADDVGGLASDSFGVPLFANVPASLTRGVFKAPALRNVELTGPYFHNGGQATIEQVLEFYSRRGDFPGDGNLGNGVAGINLNAGERTQLLAFLKALTDDRVRYERAPFDHPSLCIPVGHEESAPGVLKPAPDGIGLTAADRWALIPASGSGGNSVPLQTFEELLLGIGVDGSRAHNLTQSCVP